MKKKIGYVLLLLSILVNVTLAQRNVVSLDGTWDFCIDSLNNGYKEKWYKKGLPCARIDQVTVPHTWNVDKKTSRYFGKAWYSKKLFIVKELCGNINKLQFDAVYHDAKIWVNGVFAGGHYGSGFTGFQVDVTKLFVYGKENLIVVLANNSMSNDNIPFSTSFDWSNDGGIIRSVSLVSTGTPRIDKVSLNAYPVLNGSLTTATGLLDCQISLDSLNFLGNMNLDLQVLIKEDNQKTNKVIFQGSPEFRVLNNNLIWSHSFDSINLWSFNDPNLYSVLIKVTNKGIVTDEYTLSVGFREIKTEGDKILFNGYPIRLAGAEWMPGSSLKNGMAETKKEIQENLKKLQYTNCMFTRFHWQQDEFVYDWCDRNGILVQEEIPIWGSLSFYDPQNLEICKRQLSEMIASHRNHPSIIAWGVGNEVKGRDSLNIEGVKSLYDFVRKMDNTRLINYVSNTLQYFTNNLGQPNVKDATSYGDLMMYNDYHTTWYGQAKAGIAPLMDEIARDNVKKPLVISEFGLCQPENYGDDERRLIDLIYSYAVYESKPFIGGVIYFCLNDYRTHMGKGLHDFHTVRIHGVYDLEGNPKASAEVLRKMNCPIEISQIFISSDKMLSVNLVANAGFPSYPLIGFKAYLSESFDNFEELGQVVEIETINPGKTKFIKFEDRGLKAPVLTIVNARGKNVLQKKINYVPLGY